MDQKTGGAAIVSIILAVGSYILTCTGHPIWGLIAAVLAVPAGLLGLTLSASPKVSGGILSIIAIILAALGLIVAILGILGVIIT